MFTDALPATALYHYHCPVEETQTIQWRVEQTAPFDELIVSWNAKRPLKGMYAISVRVKTDEWSDWLPYAYWGAFSQGTMKNEDSARGVSVYQDTLEVTDGKTATAFEVKVDAIAQAAFECFSSLHACCSKQASVALQQVERDYPFISLDVKGLSQVALNHSRHMDLCSPTSTTAVIRYLRPEYLLDAASFADKAHDDGFDIYGNWILNVAQAYVELQGNWDCYVTRLNGFDQLYQHLAKGTPVIVSVRGPLPSSPLPYNSGHLIAVTGYDATSDEILCVDPAFPSDEQTVARYSREDFLAAWQRRKLVSYVFESR